MRILGGDLVTRRVHDHVDGVFGVAHHEPVIEREESRAGTELGAAQKDTARELGAKLSSLKGIVWVGVGLFVFDKGGARQSYTEVLPLH